MSIRIRRELSLALVGLLVALGLSACGDSTPTAATTTTSAGITTAAATSVAATSLATTAATTATATTAASATTAGTATTAASATTAATSAPTGPGGVAPAPTLAALPAGAKKGGTLTLAVGGTLPATLPADGSSADVVGNYLATSALLWAPGLLDYNYTTLQWQLALAKDMQVDASGKTFTFTLRPDLKWSDGSPMTPEDFQFTFENIAKPNQANPFAQYALLSNLIHVTAYKGDNAANTVTITLDQVYARDVALYYLNFPPSPKKVWNGKPFFDPANNPEIKKPSVVSGPYKIDTYDANSQGVFVANENWYMGRANFDKIVLKPVAPNLVYEAVKTGQADAALTFLPPSQYNEAKANSNLNIYEWYGVQDDYRYLVYNTTKAPFNDKALRQAIVYALDRNTMIKLGESGRATAQYTFLNENSPYFNPEINHYEYSLDKSKKLLSDNGYTLQGSTLSSKAGQPIQVNLDYDNTDVPAKALATYIQAQLQQIGIKVTVNARDSQAYLVELLTKQYDMGLGLTGGSVFPDPDAVKFFYTKDGVFNTAGYVVPRIDEVFGLGSQEQDPAKRKQLYGEAEKILTDDLPSATLYARLNFIAASKKLGGVVPSKGGTVNLNASVAAWYFNQ